MQTFQTKDDLVERIVKKYMGPTVLALIGSTITVVINSLIVGNRMGSQGLAALNLLNPVYFLFATLGALINVGTSVNAAICIGKKEREVAAGYVTIAFGLSVLISLLVSGLGLLFFKQLSAFLGATETLAPYVWEYGRIFLAGGGAITLMYFPFNFAKIAGKPEIGSWMCGINLVLDLLFCWLTIGVLKMGLAGVAFSFVGSMAIGDAVGIWMLFRSKEFTGFGRVIGFGECLINMIRTGSAMALNNVCNIFKTLFLNYAVLHTAGEVGLTVFAVIGTVNSFSNSVISGVAQTITPLIGIFFGEQDNVSIEEVIQVAKRRGRRIVLLMTFAVIGMSPFMYRIMGISDIQAGKMLIPAMILFSLSFLPGMWNHVYIFHYFTSKKVALANVLMLLRGLLILSGVAALGSVLGSINLIWLSFFLGEVFTMCILLIGDRIYCRQNQKIRSLTYLEREKEDESRFLALSVENQPERAAEASEGVAAFCESWEISPEVQMALSLAVEELLLLVFEHCFSGMEGKKYVDVRIVKTAEGIILRMRNDGKDFNPIVYCHEKKQSLAEEDLWMDDSMGISMLEKVAKEISYTEIFGMNHLFVVL